MKILVTGAKGFIGENLVGSLRAQQPDCKVWPLDIDSTADDLTDALAAADFVFHLAGVNRPQHEREFQVSNADFTAQLCDRLLKLKRAVPIVLSSSVQTKLDNPYGLSKRQAEEAVKSYARKSGAGAVIYRLKNVFGKWCRPNYNSVVATFCHNIAHDLPITISEPHREIELIYIDDVIHYFLCNLALADQSGLQYIEIEPAYKIKLGDLAELIRSFRQMRVTLQLPDFSNDLTRKLYGTYLSYLDPADFAYNLEQKSDARGCLAEFAKAHPFGQIFVSRTHPGVTRGNHYHDTKSEKFLVLEGKALIRLRCLHHGSVIEYRVKGKDLRVVDIPPGYTHSIENVGTNELVTLFLAAEVLDPERPDTNTALVIPDK